ncbi:MAG TPA: hypothetical protein VJ302_05810 [Blastocatellia bacterium]|nr:hypothetical protein [Blastocatellia bacterium]
MAETELNSLPSTQLFRLCATHFSDNTYWEEFVSRYNQILVRGVYHGYRRFGRQTPPSKEVVADLLQDVYIEVLKNQCASLLRFRGQTELEAQAYLVRLAANITSNHLRRTAALKRQAINDRLDELFRLEEEVSRTAAPVSDYTDSLADRELIELLQRNLSGENSRRDIILYLLHVREGLTMSELADSGICSLKPSSIAQIIRRIRTELKKIY